MLSLSLIQNSDLGFSNKKVQILHQIRYLCRKSKSSKTNEKNFPDPLPHLCRHHRCHVRGQQPLPRHPDDHRHPGQLCQAESDGTGKTIQESHTEQRR